MNPVHDRRQFLIGTGLSSVAIGTGALSVSLFPSPAKAWAAAAAGMGKVALDIYKMSKGGGGGIGDLLAAQTEMLRAINAQITVISETLNQVYEGIIEIRDLLAVMPQAVTEAGFRGDIRGAVVWGGQTLQNIEIYKRQVGVDRAILQYGDQAQEILNRIRQPVGALSLEPSVANLPIACLAWYTEFQLMTQGIEFDPIALRTSAEGYSRMFGKWLDSVRGELAQCDAMASNLVAAVDASNLLKDTTCYTSIRQDYWAEAYGHDGNLQRTRGRVRAEAHTFSSRPEELTENARIFTAELEQLKALGIQVSPVIQSMSQPVWSHATSGHEWRGRWYNEGQPRADQIAENARVNGARCSGAVSQPAAFPRNEQTRLVTIDRVRQKAVMHYHLLLAGQEAKRSVDAVLQRLT